MSSEICEICYSKIGNERCSCYSLCSDCCERNNCECDECGEKCSIHIKLCPTHGNKNWSMGEKCNDCGIYWSEEDNER